jgi:mono/diheme cytochrome c family protein
MENRIMNSLGFRIGRWLLLFSLAIAFVMSSSARADDPASLYKAKCVACHAADGSGTPVGIKLGAHDLRSADVQKMSEAELTEIISNGKNKMPAYAKTLKPDDVKGLVAFIRSLAAKK